MKTRSTGVEGRESFWRQAGVAGCCWMQNCRRTHRERLNQAIEAHYRRLGAEVKVVSWGAGLPDLVGVWNNGNLLVGEIKKMAESAANLGWRREWQEQAGRLVDTYARNFRGLSRSARAWCGVVDGQLREYTKRHGASVGELVVEGCPLFEPGLYASLRFLLAEKRIRHWNRDYEGNLGFYSIHFTGVPGSLAPAVP